MSESNFASMLTVANNYESIQKNAFTHMIYLQVWKRDVEILIHICKPYQSHICDNKCAEIALLNQTVIVSNVNQKNEFWEKL
jgi:hypothetical protein